MPVVLRSGPYRFHFYAGDREEPPHIHIARDAFEVKLWLDPVRVDRVRGFSAREVGRIERLTRDHQQELLDAWDEFFDH